MRARVDALTRLFAAACAVLFSACVPRPAGELVVRDVTFEGVDEFSDADLEEAMATRETPTLFGVRGLVYDWETFNQFVLERDLHRIRRLYHSRGFHRAEVSAGRFTRTEGDVNVTVVVAEGPQTTVGKVKFEGLRVSVDAAQAARSAFTKHVAVGDPYDEIALEAGRDGMREALANQGFTEAKTELRVMVDLPRNTATVVIKCEPGGRRRVKRVIFEGAEGLPEQVLLDAVDMAPGDLITEEKLERAEGDLMALGVFTSVTVKTEKVEPKDDVPRRALEPSAVGYANLRVTFQRAKTKALTLGGGVEADVTKSNVHLKGGWRDSNFANGLRTLSFGVAPGLAFYPTRVPDFESPERLLPQVKADVDFVQPRPLGRKTRLLSEVDYSIYPVLLNTNPPDDAPIVGYREFRGRVGIERSWRRFTLTPSYNLQAGVPFTYVGDLAASASSVYISYLELLGELDFRDNKQSPHEGLYTALRVQGAGLGGTARDFRLEPEVRGYTRLWSRNTVLASRLKFGFLFPSNYETPSETREVSVADSQISYFRSFFSGGPISNRGYPFRGVGPAGHLEFFYPLENAALSACQDEPRDPSCTVPLGGTTLWEFSAEVRFPIWLPFSGAVFCDMSDVSQGREWDSFLRPHTACGVGPRYDTPIGPIRIDLAYRIPGLQNMTNRVEGIPRDLLGLPINISFGIGEAF